MLWRYCLGNFADLDCVRSFRTVGNFKCHFVTFAKLVERNADKLVRVEKEIFFHALALDEPESLIGKTGNCSFLHIAI
ncbi:MAG: hypothetical protein G01um101429_336 [Parcubacteria group bacterium Gr01-1014_29]|nr:MAG: hypothetical protein G01um101429_336 [Parcubacteria group bacterium Gr01-1014_29]